MEQLSADIRAGNTGDLIDYLRFQVRRVLRLDSSIDLAADRRLSELGLDSLTGIEIRNRIDKDLGVKLSLEQFFDQASVTRWSDFIKERLALDRISQNGTMAEDRLEEGYEEATL
jgi:acyl carrier protein